MNKKRQNHQPQKHGDTEKSEKNRNNSRLFRFSLYFSVVDGFRGSNPEFQEESQLKPETELPIGFTDS
jgi:hypothetical protein